MEEKTNAGNKGQVQTVNQHIIKLKVQNIQPSKYTLLQTIVKISIER